MANEPIGTVAQSIGNAVAIDRNGNERRLQTGDKVYVGETIRTDNQYGIEIRLENGRTIDAGRGSELPLNNDILNLSAETNEVEAIQAAIAAGADPSDITEPPAAGTLEDDGFSTVRIEYAEPRAIVENGFDTTGINFDLVDVRDGASLVPGPLILSRQATLTTPITPVVENNAIPGVESSTNAVVFTITASPAAIQEGSQQAALFTISRNGGPLAPGVIASVTVTTPFEDGDTTPAATSQDLNQTLFNAIFNATQNTPGVSFDQQTGVLSFSGNANSLEFSVTSVADNDTEGTEDIVVNLSSPVLTEGTASIQVNTANIDIVENTTPPPIAPALSINDVTVTEGVDNTVTFTVTRTGNLNQISTVDYAVTPGTATAPGDYTANDAFTGVLNFAAGEATKTITLNVVNDSFAETTESFSVNLQNASNASIADGTGIGTILENNWNVAIQPQHDDILNQAEIFTIVDLSNPINAYSKIFPIGYQGQNSQGQDVFLEANFTVDPGPNVASNVDYLVSVEDASTVSTNSIQLSGISGLVVNGVTIYDPANGDLRFRSQPDQFGGTSAVTAQISPDDSTLLQTLTTSTDGSLQNDTVTDPSLNQINYLNGLAGNDSLTGGSGIDILNGGAGQDQLQSGAGNDILVFDANDIQIDGGTGFDLLRIDSSADLRGNTAITNIEGLLITDDVNSDPNAGSTVQLNAQDVLDFTDSGNTLSIIGNNGDQLTLDSGFSTNGVVDTNGMVTYTAVVNTSQVNVMVEESVQVTIA